MQTEAALAEEKEEEQILIRDKTRLLVHRVQRRLERRLLRKWDVRKEAPLGKEKGTWWKEQTG